ncbi:hypothetical protein Sru01_16360 [Sphaerisporangium rufum]|uniref:Uncharacterized protein n=2 Tax=Sphaerisporangium rufum TaxID=1381558 RepID=A0A919QYZ9_9ACTN|nr:hypothetical protein Sru01_16360 [Sphaerisporangium rufum]
MGRLLAETKHEFPGWSFTHATAGWTATKGDQQHRADSLAALRTVLRGFTEGWHIWRSDHGRWWATRDRPFDAQAARDGAARTVDGDTEVEVRRAISEQESIAASQI